MIDRILAHSSTWSDTQAAIFFACYLVACLVVVHIIMRRAS